MDTFATINNLHTRYVQDLTNFAIQDFREDYATWEVTCDRLAMNGAVDALRTLALELGYTDASLWALADEVEEVAVENYKALGGQVEQCRHGYYSTTAQPTTFGGQDAYANRCDNCNAIVSITL